MLVAGWLGAYVTQAAEARREVEHATRQMDEAKKLYSDRETEIQRLKDELHSNEKSASLRAQTLAEKLHKMRVRVLDLPSLACLCQQQLLDERFSSFCRKSSMSP